MQGDESSRTCRAGTGDSTQHALCICQPIFMAPLKLDKSSKLTRQYAIFQTKDWFLQAQTWLKLRNLVIQSEVNA